MTAPAARWFHADGRGRLVCDLCPRGCRLADGQRGFCAVRRREGAAIRQDAWGRASGFAVDPIEKKPLFHFLPGTSVLSFGTAGCNLGCKFCQNWRLSFDRGGAHLAEEASPEGIARTARRLRCPSVAFTYNEPGIAAEWTADVADACRALGVRTVAVTNGYVNPAPRRELFARIDAANVDLKGFTDGFYRRLTGARLGPVLDTIAYLARETAVWLELTTLLIPGENDGDEELERMCAWIAGTCGVDVPLHLSAFHPAFRLAGHPPTSRETLDRARRIARAAGLRHVYVGNVRDREGGITRCPGCGAGAIVREGFEVRAVGLDADGACAGCGCRVPGRWR